MTAGECVLLFAIVFVTALFALLLTGGSLAITVGVTLVTWVAAIVIIVRTSPHRRPHDRERTGNPER